ncbi:CapA family protein [Candidatus Saccharibacteria bacterium]|nr:CapA family protein [Candidatus Saccharibacteria bacterium]
MKKFFLSLIGAIIVGAGVFFGGQYITKTGVFRIPGVVYYDESLTEEEIARIEEVFTDEIDLDKDVYISGRYEFSLPELEAGEFLSAVFVPVTDFYSTETNLNVETAEEFFDQDFQNENKFSILNVMNLDFKVKLLKLNDKYFLDELKQGGIYRILSFKSEKYEDEISPLAVKIFGDKVMFSEDEILTFAQTGVTALSRGMNAKLRAVGGDATYFSEKIADFLSGFDLTHTSNESSFTDFASDRNICSDKRFINTLLDIGVDVIELTGNHNQDCGDTAALETLDVYDANGLKTVGGGRTATEAAKPLLIDEKGSGITMLAYNLSTGGATYDNTPGANQYYEENAVSEIAAAKERGDFVIVDIQYYECNAYASTYEDATCDYPQNTPGNEIGFFRHLIDLGADVVVGTSAHQTQTFELYGEGVIYYGLGNLFFDQVWWPGTTRSLVLGHYFHNGKLLQTKLTPTVYDANMQVQVMDSETAKWFIGRLVEAKP